MENLFEALEDLKRLNEEDQEGQDLEAKLYQAIKKLNLTPREVTEKDLEDWD